MKSLITARSLYSCRHGRRSCRSGRRHGEGPLSRQLPRATPPRSPPAYASDATLHWIGGPLDGSYEGDAIAGVWTKFAKAQTGLKATVKDISESMNPKGATVVANVVFANAKKIPVRYVMLFRDGKLTDEIWQIDPSLAKISAKTPCSRVGEIAYHVRRRDRHAGGAAHSRDFVALPSR